MYRMLTSYIHVRSRDRSVSLSATRLHRPTRSRTCSYQRETRPGHSKYNQYFALPQKVTLRHFANT